MTQADDLGRVVIPKEIRRTMRIREGDPLEIYTDREGEDADNIDTRCPILVCSDGFIQENWTELKKNA